MPTRTPAQTEMSKIYVDMIRLLFEIVLGLSFTLLTRHTSEGGFREWFVDPLTNLSGILTLVLIYTLIITSFVGYHQSTKSFPILKPWRFVIDIALLFLYFVAIVVAQKFQDVLLVFVTIFFLYVIWNSVRVIEYTGDEDAKNLLMESFRSFGVFVLSLFGYFGFTYLKSRIEWIDLVVGVGLLVLLLVFRALTFRKYMENDGEKTENSESSEQ